MVKGEQFMEKKIYLEQLFDKIRGMAEEYDLDEGDTEAILLKEKEVGSFVEDLLRVVNGFIKTEIATEEELAAVSADDDEEELYITDWFDDDLD